MKSPLILLLNLFVCCITTQAQLNLQWQELGPDDLGGPVRALILDNRDSTRQTLYAGVMGGGVWKTTDGGAWWTYLGCAGNYAVSCMAQASDGTIYVGTGDGIVDPYGSNTDEGHLGNGIYKLNTLDNFTHLDSTTVPWRGSTWSGVNRIAINPVNPTQIIAGNSGGLYKSNNAGASWTKISIPGYTNYGSGIDVKWSTDGSKIFADVGYVLSTTSLVRSIDGGNTWNKIDSVNHGFPKGYTERIEIAIAPSNATVTYISISSTSGNLLGIFKTTDAGNTWDSVALGRTVFNSMNGQGWYDNAIAVSPGDSSKIYFGGTSMYSFSPQTGINKYPYFNYTNVQAGYYIEQFLYVTDDKNPEIVYAATNRGVFKTTEALSNFTSAQFNAANYGMKARDFISVAAARNGQVMGDCFDDQCILIGNISNQHFTNLNLGRGYCDFSHIDTNFSFIEAYQGTLYESNNMMASFFSALDTSIDPMGYGQATRCGSSYGNALYFAPLLLHETKSAFETNDSVSYVAPSAQVAGSTISVNSSTANTEFQYNLPVTLNTGQTLRIPDPVKSNLFIATNCGIWMKRHAIGLVSPDWYQISKFSANCLAVTKNGNKVYAANSGGQVISVEGLNLGHYKSYKMVDSFITSNKVVRSGADIQSIAVDPNNDSVLLVTVGTYNNNTSPNAYKSNDAGLTWEAKQIGPVRLPVFSCVIDANNSNNYIVGTEHGIWSSSDSGATWHQDDANMCDVPVFQVRQIPLLTDDCYVLYAATNSRGLWRSFTLTPAGCNTSLDIHSPSNSIPDDFTIYPNPTTSHTTVEFAISEPQQVTIKLYDITGRPVQTWQQFLSGENQKVELNTAYLHTGTYLVSVETRQGVKTKLLVIEE